MKKIALALSCLWLASASAAEPKKITFSTTCENSRSAELKALADADQADRSVEFSNLPEKEIKKISERDDQRRKRVGEIFAEGCLRVAADYNSAALIFQHGSAPEHFFQTYIWASRAVALGDPSARWLVSRGIDRYLMNTGSKQLYATQGFSEGERGCSCLWPVEESATDEDRKKIGADTMAERLKWIDGLNTGKTCGPAAVCDIEAKPVPKGSVPGVAW
jgi:hypothetical protein